MEDEYMTAGMPVVYYIWQQIKQDVWEGMGCEGESPATPRDWFFDAEVAEKWLKYYQNSEDETDREFGIWREIVKVSGPPKKKNSPYFQGPNFNK